MHAIRCAVVFAFGASLAACSQETPRRAEPAPIAPVVTEPVAQVAPAPPKEDAVPDFDQRDPFQQPVAEAPLPPPPPPRDARKARRWSPDDLKLVGLVTRTDAPRAMLVDPKGKGWVVAQGDVIGRPELVRGSYLASWRVDRIRDDGVTLVRDDVGTKRVLAMHAAALPNADDEAND